MSLFEEHILRPMMWHFTESKLSNSFFIDNTYYSYDYLYKRVLSIRNEIKKIATDEKLFAIAVHDDIDTYASIFALWMEGKGYVPIHPKQPFERNIEILNQVKCSYILDSAESSVYDNNNLSVVPTSVLTYAGSGNLPIINTSDDEIAYILFTSGSTGKPKGACLSRKNLATFVKAMNEIYQMSESDRCLQCFDLTFDLSVMSYLLPIISGACAYTVSYDVVKYAYVAMLMQNYGITFSMMTPSVILYLRPYFDELYFPAMRCSMFAGEALPTEVAIEWSKCLPNARIVNSYGPTETTIICTFYPVNRVGGNLEHNGILALGKEMYDTDIIIVDDNDRVIPKPTDNSNSPVGELCMAGGQVMPGYWNNPEKNAKVFFIKNGKRYYRSGDMGFYGKDGVFMFSSRKDFQVKIQGFRIELGEIEYHIHHYMGNVLSLVMAYNNDEGTNSLAVFIEAEQQDPEPLKEYLRSKLPPYMLPDRYIYIPSFPMNSSNKIDRQSLIKQIK